MLMTHPETGQTYDVPDASVRVFAKRGWVDATLSYSFTASDGGSWDAPERPECDDCDATFATERGLSIHRSVKHPEGS